MAGGVNRMVVPYCKSYPKAMLVWAEDTIFEFLDTYIQITLNSIEEVPKDAEDDLLGTKEKKRDSQAIISKSSIVSVEYGYDDHAESYDFTIFTNSSTWGYNCATRVDAIKYYTIIKDWWLSA